MKEGSELPLREGKRGRPFYGWVVAGACSLVLFNGAGRLRSFGLFFNPLRTDFGWTPTVISSFQSANGMVRVGTTLLGGWLTGKLGARQIVVIFTMIANVSMALLSQVRNLGQFYVLYALSGAGGPLLPIAQGTPQRWFRSRRGLVLGIVTAGGGIGGFLYPPVVNLLIPAYGWRATFIFLGVVASILNLTAAALLVESPEKKGMLPYGAGTGGAGRGRAAGEGPSWTVRQALRTRGLPLLCISLLLTSIPGNMLTTHLFPFAVWIGIAPAMAAGAFGAMSIIGIPTRLMLGAITPGVLGWKKGLMLYTALAAGAMLLLSQTRSLWMLWVFVVVYSTASTARGTLELGIIGEYYGMKSLTALLSVNTLFTWAGQLFGPLLGGLLYDRTGDYSVAFLGGALLLALATLALVPIAPPRLAPEAPSA